MHRSFKYISYPILATALLWVMVAGTGCTGLGKIGKDEYLFTGGDIQYDSVNGLSKKKVIKSTLEGLITPAPNTKFLWMRPFLAIHNLVGDTDKEKGLKYWLSYKLGQKPVLLKDVKPDLISDAMSNRLENHGHFNATTGYKINKHRKTASITFHVHAGLFYTIRSVSFPPPKSILQKAIDSTKGKTLIKPHQPYDLDVFEQERQRIDDVLKNSGYFYFSPQNMLFIADTMVGHHQIDVNLTLKPDMPEDARIPFRIHNVYVHDDYSLQNYHPDTLHIGTYYYLTDNSFFKPSTVLEAVFLRKDSLYSRRDHFNTLSHLMGLGIYKFANARFVKVDSLQGELNANIYLTPYKKMSVTAEMSAAVKTNNFAGPGLKLSFKNRNTFRGAELLTINLKGRFETQYSGKYRGETSYEISMDASLSFPRFVPIRFQRNVSRQYVPTTVITAGGGIYSRVRLYELHSFNLSLGYNWRHSDRISHSFKPIDISFTNLAKSSTEFETYLQNNPTIRRSFEEQFILGSAYTFTYSTMHLDQKRNRVFVSEGADVSGNLASLATRLTSGSWSSPENQQKLLNVPYSQFARIRSEVRFFHTLNKNSELAWRLITAAGVPYGNSSTMPYIKQFFVGGTNSVRAFQARTVGPGTYQPPDSVSNIFVDQTGDIKVESSLEYRFGIYKFVKGALFADAGNIWLVNADAQRPGGKFNINNFYRQLAVGTGFGIRFDFNFVVIRFDLAFPVRKPFLPQGQRWVFNKINPGSRAWRRDNLVLNIAIGYPF